MRELERRKKVTSMMESASLKAVECDKARVKRKEGKGKKARRYLAVCGR
jgi:hypothetical protein